jgi:hypothetical protein
MSSKKYTVTVFGALVALTIAVGGSLAAIHTNSNNSVHAAQTVRRTIVNYQGVAGMNALAILKQKHHVQTKTYSGLGEEVTSIDGVVANSKHYWAFYVNGKMAQVGAGTYTTKPNDTLTWKLASL